MISTQTVLSALATITDPDIHRDIISLGFIKGLRIDGENVAFTIELTTPACPVREQMQEAARRVVLALPGITHVRASAGVMPLPDLCGHTAGARGTNDNG